jgi:hypothetical protein
LRGRCEHVEGCTERRCAPKCGFRLFEEWLSGPVIAADVAEDERFRRLLVKSDEPVVVDLSGS